MRVHVKCYHNNLPAVFLLEYNLVSQPEVVVEQCVPAYSYLGPAIRFNPEYLDRRRTPEQRAGVGVQNQSFCLFQLFF